MGKANPPPHINRRASNAPSNPKRIGAAQKKSDNHRQTKVTLKTPPWEQKEPLSRRNNDTR